MSLVVAAEYLDEVKASIAAGMLDANGIPSVLEGTHVAQMYFSSAIWNPVRLMVRQDDLDAALELLRQHGDI